MTTSLDEAAQAFKARDYQRARQLFRQAVEQDPANGKAWFFLGQTHVSLGEHQEALAAFQRVEQGGDPRLTPLARQASQSLLGNATAQPAAQATVATAEPVVAEAPPMAQEPVAAEPTAAADQAYDEPGSADAAPAAIRSPREPRRLCDVCGMPIPRERWEAPWCACGFGQPASTEANDRLPLATLLAYQRAARGAIELNVRNDHYTLAGKLKVKQLSSRATEIDARLVFPLDRGAPYLRKGDFGVVKNDQVKDAVFGLGFSGYFTWEDGLAEFTRVLGPDALRQPTSLRSLLLDFGGFTEAELDDAEARRGDATLGEALMDLHGLELEELIQRALGARVATPAHHGANELGHQLVAQGVVSQEQLTKAIMTQLSARKPLLELLGGNRIPAEAVQAAQETIGSVEWAVPARDAVGEILYQRGLLNRTDLALAERDAKEKETDPVDMLAGKGKVDARALDAARKRAAMKLHLRKEGMIRLGEVLVKQQACPAAAVAEALQVQVEDHRPLGALLVALGHCAPEQIIFALDEQEAALDALAEKVLADREKKAAARRPAAAPPPRELSRLEKLLAMIKFDRRMAAAGVALVLLPLVGLAVRQHMQAAAHQAQLVEKIDALLVVPPPLLAEPPRGVPKELAAKLTALYDQEGPISVGDIAAARRKAPQAFDQVMAELTGKAAPKGASALPPDDDRLVDALLPLKPEAPEGERLLALGRPAEALTALGQDPKPRAALARAKAYRLLDQPAKALAAAQDAAKQAPTDHEALLAVARAAAQAHQADQALAAFAKLPPDDPAGRAGRAAVLLEAGRADEATAALAEVLKVDASNGAAHLQLGQRLMPKDPAQGLEHLVAAAEALSHEVTAALARSSAARDKGNTLVWIAELQASMAADARLAGAYQELQLALADKDGPHAQECFRRSAATFRSNARALVDLGDAYVAAGSPTQAIQAWTLAARLAPFNPVPVARLAVLARSQGQGDASAKLAELAVKRAPK